MIKTITLLNTLLFSLSGVAAVTTKSNANVNSQQNSKAVEATEQPVKEQSSSISTASNSKNKKKQAASQKIQKPNNSKVGTLNSVFLSGNAVPLKSNTNSKAKSVNPQKVELNSLEAELEKADQVAGSTTSSVNTQKINSSSSSKAKLPSASEVEKTNNKPIFSLKIDSGYDYQATEQEDNKRDESITTIIAPKVKFGNLSLGSQFWYTKDMKDDSQSDWSFGSITLARKPWEVGDYLTLAPSIGGELPVSRDSKFNFSFGPGVSVGLNSKNLNMEELALSYDLAFRKVFLRDRPVEGSPETTSKLLHVITLGYELIPKLSAGAQVLYSNKFNSDGEVDANYAYSLGLEYEITKNFSVNTSYNLGKSKPYTIKETNNEVIVESDFKTFDPKATSYGVGVSISL